MDIYTQENIEFNIYIYISTIKRYRINKINKYEMK